MEQPILQVEHLTKFFSVGPHAEVHAVDDVNFTLRRGRTFGLVGESGCGKSSCARTIIRIYEPSQGKIIFNGQDIAHLKPRQMQPVRRNMQMIFQDPYASLNARMTVRDIIAEPLETYHVCKTKAETTHRVLELMQAVGVPAEFLNRYPHQFSGGQRQRLTIARALVPHPQVLILDDSSSALDFATDAALRKALKEQTHGMTVFIVSQRASAVQRADRILVLDDGNLVGSGTHANLLKTCDVYREICLSQLSREEVEKTL